MNNNYRKSDLTKNKESFMKFNEENLVLYYKSFMDNWRTGRFEFKRKGPVIIYYVIEDRAYN